MAVTRLVTRVPQHRLCSLMRPIVGLVLIAAMTAIEEIAEVVSTSPRLGLVVVDRQLAACIDFGDATKLASEMRPLTNKETNCC